MGEVQPADITVSGRPKSCSLAEGNVQEPTLRLDFLSRIPRIEKASELLSLDVTCSSWHYGSFTYPENTIKVSTLPQYSFPCLVGTRKDRHFGEAMINANMAAVRGQTTFQESPC